ncbi:MAG: IgA Peptidase M64 [Acidobacteria bacterium]|nr:IgA Peptidase M64 [Acidobacteriota bacterium]
MAVTPVHIVATLIVVAMAVEVTAVTSGQSPVGFDAVFLDKTMRVDYVHTGGLGQEVIALDQVVSDGPWSGGQSRLVDDLNLGKYRFEVIDRRTNRVLYSRGFASIYGEWETTPEFREVSRSFHESLRFPWPKAPVQVVLKVRDAQNSFHELWSTVIDPDSRFVNPADRAPLGELWTIFEHGPPSEKVDLLVIGDGYTEAELPKFHADATRLVNALFEEEPFRSRKSDFNVWGLDLPSDESGVSRPRAAAFRRTPLSAEYNIFDSERYVLTYDNRALRDAASAAPYEFLEILVNEEQYGGGGIFNFQATAAVDTGFAEYVFIHEFGHHFAGLADEYYTSDVAYETGAAFHIEPWEPNVTALHDPQHVKWGDLIASDTPLPTPWDKETFERGSIAAQGERRDLRLAGAEEAAMDRLFTRQMERETALLGSMTHAGKVGAFEGASYEPIGLYRSEVDCIMFTRNPVGFCRVCRRAIENVINQYTGRE